MENAEDHTHSKNCWRSLNRECVEFKIREQDAEIISWTSLAIKMQNALRVAKGQIDKIESEITRAINYER